MLKVAVIGVSGYGGSEVLRILKSHSGAKITHFGANTQAGIPLSKSLGHFYRIYDNNMEKSDLLEIAKENDCIIAATPHEFLAHKLTSEMIKSCVIIDLSADFRLKNPKKYEEYYGFTHSNLDLLKDSVYGLCELNRDFIKRANLIANPGCYPTCSTLCIAPLLMKGIIEPNSIIIDAKSGVSGAGRSAKVDNLFCEVHENIKAYGLVRHRHVAEIEQNLEFVSQINSPLQCSGDSCNETIYNATSHLKGDRERIDSNKVLDCFATAHNDRQGVCNGGLETHNDMRETCNDRLKAYNDDMENHDNNKIESIGGKIDCHADNAVCNDDRQNACNEKDSINTFGSADKELDSINITFTPHLIPMNRGILVTAYATLSSKYKDISQADLDSIYAEFCHDKYFVRHLKDGMPPQTRWVKGSNFTDISVCLDKRNNRVIMMGAIDNLVKGAAGQAVQNLNIRFGFDEKMALDFAPLFP